MKGLKLADVAFLGLQSGVAGGTEDFQSYSDADPFASGTLNLGTGWALPGEALIGYDSLVFSDTFQSYSDTAAVGAMSGGFGFASDSAPMTVLTVAFSPAPDGTLPATVTLSCPESGSASIYYTTNGTTPTTSSTLYTTPLSISSNTQIKALAVSSGYVNSAVTTQAYGNTVDASYPSSLALWLKADALSLSNGASVSTWPDSSGNGRSVTQPTGANQPVYTTNVQNSLPAVRFGTSAGMLTDLVLSSLPYTIFILYSYRSATSAGRRAMQGSSNWLIGPYSNLSQVYNGGFLSSPPAVTQNAFVLHRVRQISGTAQHYTAKTLRGSNSNSGTPGTVSFGLTGAFAEPLDGDIAEVLIYTKDMSTAEAAIVENYLYAKWNL